MKTKLALATLLLVGLTTTANAALINASEYFNGLITSGSTSQQVTNTWQLGFINGSGTFSLFNYSASGSVVGAGDQSKFDSYSSATYVGFGVNVSNTGAGYFGDTIAANELYAHPGNGSPDLVLRFLAAADGLYEFDTTIRNAHTGLVGTSVMKDSTTLLTQQIMKATSTLPDSVTFSQQLSLSSGATVDFIINDVNGWGADGIAINANAGPVDVSAPSTLAILGLTLLTFARVSRKTK